MIPPVSSLGSCVSQMAALGVLSAEAQREYRPGKELVDLSRSKGLKVDLVGGQKKRHIV